MSITLHPSQEVHIGVIDNKPIVLYGIQHLLNNEAGITVDFLSTNIDSFFEYMDKKHTLINMVLCDYEFANDKSPDGVCFLKKIHRRYPNVKVIIFVSDYRQHVVPLAINAGVLGFVDKHSDIANIIKAIRHVKKTSNLFFSESIMKAYLMSLNSCRMITEKIDLSKSEFEVARLIGAGLSLDEIALKLHKSPKTISNQKNSAMKKIGINADVALAQSVKLKLTEYFL